MWEKQKQKMIKWSMISKNKSRGYKAKMNNQASTMEFSKKAINNSKDNCKIVKNQAERNCQNHKYGKIYITT